MANRPPYPGTPRWVKVFGIIAILLIVLVAISLATGHGPRRHTPSAGSGGKVAASGFVEAFARPRTVSSIGAKTYGKLRLLSNL